MREVKILIGLPGAKKTTWARSYVTSGNYNTAIITLDAIREMMYGRYDYREELEPLIYQIAVAIIRQSLRAGLDIIIDDTMLILTKQSREHLVNFLRSYLYACGKISIQAVTFQYDQQCVINRTSDPRGLDPSRWLMVINEMMLKFEPVSDAEDFDSIVKSHSFSFS
jgi:predicted kinase